MIGILGSGFGLYGYLPAVCAITNLPVYLLEKSRSKLLSRPELIQYKEQVIFLKDIQEMIHKCNMIIIAYPPETISNLVEDLIKAKTLKKVIIEKPMSTNPDEALRNIDKLKNAGISVFSGYIFFYTDWFKKIINQQGEDLIIEWNFNTKQNNWKVSRTKGGGALPMYGIHLLSIMAALEMCPLTIIENSDYHFKAIFIKSTNGLIVTIDLELSDKPSSFVVRNIYNEKTPFGGENIVMNEDVRVKYLIDLLQDIEQDTSKLEFINLRTIHLWKEVEQLYSSLN